MSKMNRRAFVSSAALATAAAATLAAGSVTADILAEADPAIAAVDKARAAWASFNDLVSRQNRLSGSLPKTARKSSIYASEITVVDTDDPRWIASMHEYRQSSDALDNAFMEILDDASRPTSALGIAAVLQLAADSYENGQPDYAPDESGETWAQAVSRMCASVLVGVQNDAPAARVIASNPHTWSSKLTDWRDICAALDGSRCLQGTRNERADNAASRAIFTARALGLSESEAERGSEVVRRSLLIGGANNASSAATTAALEWASEWGISLDWLFVGNLGPTLSNAAQARLAGAA